MAIKQFAVPLNDKSQQTGDVTFEKLVENAADVEFKLTNVKHDTADQLNLITKKGAETVDHIFPVTVAAEEATVTLTPKQLGEVLKDTIGGDGDYVEANWSLGTVDFEGDSVMYAIQGQETDDYLGWPPKK